MANSRIAGITVEIGGDTTKHSAALKNVNTEIRSTQSQLKDVNKLLKIDPGNTELLVQKQRLLKTAIQETKEKLEQLRTAAQQAKEQLEAGEISQAQYDGLQREIVETEQKLKDLEAQASKSHIALEKMAAVGENMKVFGKKVSDVGMTLTRTVTAPIVGLGAAAIKTAADFDSAMSKVAAISGATGSDFDALRDKAREMGSKTKFSATEAAQAMNYMAMAGWKTSDMLSGIDGIMNLAAASGEDLATTSDIVTDALTAFGLTAADSGHFADILAAASSNANTNVSMMGETFKYAAPIAGALGFTAEDTALAIGLMANAGIKSSQAGTALRTIMNNLAGEVTVSGRAFGDMTIATVNQDGSMRSLNEIMTDLRGAFSQMTESERAMNAENLVGKHALSGFLAIMNAAPSDVKKLSDSIDNCDGSSKKMAETMQDNLSGQLTILLSQLQELAISFADVVMPVLRKLVDHLQSIVDWLNGFDSETKEAIISIGMFAAALGPVLIFIGKVITAIGTILSIVPKIASAIGGVTEGASALWAALAAHPIGLIIAAIAALVAAFVALWNYCDSFKQFWIDLWDALMELMVQNATNTAMGLIAVWEWLKEGTSAVWNAICDGIGVAWSFISELVSSAATAVSDFVSSAWEGIRSITESVWNSICDFFSSIWDLITNIVSNAASAVQSFIQGAWDYIKNLTSSVWNAITSFLQSAWNNITSLITGALDTVQSLIETAWNTVTEITENLWNHICDFLSSVGESIKEIVSSLWDYLTDITSSFHDAISSLIDEGLNTLKSMYDSFAETISSTVSSMWSGIKDLYSSALTFIKDLFGNRLREMLSGLMTHMSSALSTVMSKMSQIANTIGNVLSNIWQGLQNMAGRVIDCIRNLLSNIWNAFSNIISDAFNWGRDLIGNIVKGIQSMFSSLVKKVKDVAGTIADYLHFSEPDVGPLSNFHTFMPDMIDLMGKGIEENLYKLKGPMNDLAGCLVPVSSEIVMKEGLKGRDNGMDTLTQTVLRYLPKMANRQIVLDSGVLVGELSNDFNRRLGKAYL